MAEAFRDGAGLLYGAGAQTRAEAGSTVVFGCRPGHGAVRDSGRPGHHQNRLPQRGPLTSPEMVRRENGCATKEILASNERATPPPTGATKPPRIVPPTHQPREKSVDSARSGADGPLGPAGRIDG